MNGLPNLSVLDGWWDEADYVRTGWPIGHGEDYDDLAYQDDVESDALYDTIENEVVPLFYDRDEFGIPRKWIAKMKDAIRLNTPFFNTARMVRDYGMRGYFPASDRYFAMTANNYAPAKELASWKRKVDDNWYDIKIEAVDVSEPSQIMVGQTISVKARIDLNKLQPDDVQVELYQGSIDASGQIVNGIPVVMEYQGSDQEGVSIYTSNILYTSSGLQGLSLRVLPKHKNVSSPFELGLMRWA